MYYIGQTIIKLNCCTLQNYYTGHDDVNSSLLARSLYKKPIQSHSVSRYSLQCSSLQGRHRVFDASLQLLHNCHARVFLIFLHLLLSSTSSACPVEFIYSHVISLLGFLPVVNHAISLTVSLFHGRRSTPRFTEAKPRSRPVSTIWRNMKDCRV